MLMIFVLFRSDFFKKEKKRACYILMLFSTELLFKMKHDFDAQSKTKVFKMFLCQYDLNIFIIA